MSTGSWVLRVLVVALVTVVSLPGMAQPVVFATDVFGGLGMIGQLAYTPSGAEVLVAGQHGAFYALGVPDGTLRVFGQSISQTAVSPDGRYAASMTGYKLVIYDTATGQPVDEIGDSAQEAYFYDVAFSPDGAYVAYAGDYTDPETQQWEQFLGCYRLSTRSEVFRTVSDGNINLIAVAPGNAYVYSVGYAEAVVVNQFNGSDGSLNASFDVMLNGVDAMQVSFDGAYLLCSGYGGAEGPGPKLFDTATGNFVRHFPVQEDYVTGICISADGNTVLASGRGYGAGDTSAVYAWDRSTGTELWRHVFTTETAYTVGIAPDGASVAVGTETGGVVLLNGGNGSLAGTLAPEGVGGYVLTADLAPSGQQVLLGTTEGNLALMDRQTHAVLTELVSPIPGYWVRSATVSPDGASALATMENGATYLFDLGSGALVQTFSSEGHAALSAAFHPSGAVFTAGLSDTGNGAMAAVEQWNVQTGFIQSSYYGSLGNIFGQVVFSPDGNTMVAGGAPESLLWYGKQDGQTKQTEYGEVAVFNTTTGARRGSLTHELLDQVTDIAISPDGQYVAGVGADQEPLLVIWDLASLSVDRTLIVGAPALFLGVEFSPNGSQLALSGAGLVSYGAVTELGWPGAWIVNAHTGGVNTVAVSNGFLAFRPQFTQDGRYLLMTSWAGNAAMYELDTSCDAFCTGTVQDRDGDGADDCTECQQGTNVNAVDTDGDGVADGWEFDNGLNPLNASDGLLDSDGDGLTSVDEFIQNSDPNDPQSPNATVYVSGLGSNTTGNGTAAAPWATIGFALSQVTGVPGAPARINVGAGTYTEGFTLGAYTIVSGAGRELTFVSGSVTGAVGSRIEKMQVTAPVTDGTCITIDNVSMVVRDVTVTGVNRTGIGIDVSGTGAGASVIENTVFTGLATGLRLNGALPVVRRCQFTNLSGDGILVVSVGAKADAGGLGDSTDANSGWNAFQLDIDGAAVRNETSTELVMENNDWGVDDNIEARISGPADFLPALKAGSAMTVASLFCTVWDAATQERILDGVVALTPSAYQPVTANEEGIYAFTALAPGSYTVEVSGVDGYDDASLGTFVADGTVNPISIPMTKQGSGPVDPPTTGCAATGAPRSWTGELVLGLLAAAGLSLFALRRAPVRIRRR